MKGTIEDKRSFFDFHAHSENSGSSVTIFMSESFPRNSNANHFCSWPLYWPFHSLEINGKIIRLGKNIKVSVTNKKQHKKADISIHVAMSPLKNPSRFEWFVEKSTEIGISEITPIITKFSEKRKINIDRLNKIVISSMKQSNQFYLPKVNPITSFDRFENKYMCENK